MSLTAQAQTLQGVVTDGATGMPMMGVMVVNEKTQIAVTTDQHGLYTIKANTGETIAFTYVGYKTEERAKPISVIISTLNITLQPANTQLKEFTFKADKRTKYQIDSAERMVIYKTPLTRRPPNLFNSPVSAIAELFNKKARIAYAFQQAYQQEELDRFIDTRYSPALVTKMTGLTGDSIGHFMYAYPMPYMFARTATDLELKMWVRDSYKEWLKSTAVDTAKK